MRTHLTLAILAVVGTVSCNRATTDTSASSAAPSAQPTTTAAVVLGQPITSTVVPIADVAHDPHRFEGRSFATTGKVSAVCQEAGCWMEIGDEQTQAHVRMHGHSFFVPKTASGRVARVQATLVPKRPGASDSCEGSKVTQVELDATGVELD